MPVFKNSDNALIVWKKNEKNDKTYYYLYIPEKTNIKRGKYMLDKVNVNETVNKCAK